MVKKYFTKKEIKQLELMEQLLNNSEIFNSLKSQVGELNEKIETLSLEVDEALKEVEQVKKAYYDVVEENKRLAQETLNQTKTIALLQQGRDASRILTEYFYGAGATNK